MMAGPPSLWNAKVESSSPQSRQGLAEYLQCDAIRWEQFLWRCRLVSEMSSNNNYLKLLYFYIWSKMLSSISGICHVNAVQDDIASKTVPIYNKIIYMYIYYTSKKKIYVIQSIKLELMGVGDEL